MRIKHIYITKEGEPMAIPINDDGTWSESYLPFEDKKDALDFIPWEYHGYNGTIVSQHWDTLIPVDLEVEVVTIHWWQTKQAPTGLLKLALSHKTVLRIKP